MKTLIFTRRTRMMFLGMAVAVALLAFFILPAGANMEAAKKWVEEEFQPSTLTKEEQMKEMDLEIASSFLVMAATLLAIKAKMLLPTPPDEDEEEIEDARAELVHDILEYMHFKEAAQNMGNMVEAQRLQYCRPNEDELYLNMFSEENPLDEKKCPDFKDCINPESLVTVDSLKVEPSLAGAEAGTPYQFERLGYFCLDAKDAREDHLVFNSAVTLRDTWAKIQKKDGK